MYYDPVYDAVPQTPRDQLAHFMGAFDSEALNMFSTSLLDEPIYFYDGMMEDELHLAIDTLIDTVEDKEVYGAVVNAMVEARPQAKEFIPPTLALVTAEARRNKSGTSF